MLLGLAGPAIAWAAYELAYPSLPPYLALFVAAAIMWPLMVAMRPKLIEWTGDWAVDPKGE